MQLGRSTVFVLSPEMTSERPPGGGRGQKPSIGSHGPLAEAPSSRKTGEGSHITLEGPEPVILQGSWQAGLGRAFWTGPPVGGDRKLWEPQGLGVAEGADWAPSALHFLNEYLL